MIFKFESNPMSKINLLLKTFLINIVTLLSYSTYSFVSFYLLKNDKGEVILILGDYHYEESLAQKNKEHIDLFIKKALESSNATIPCVVELDKNFEPAFRGETLPAGLEMADTIAHLASYASKGIAHEKLQFVPYDSRNFDSILLVAAMRWLSQLLPHAQAQKSLFSREHWNSKVKPNFLHTPEAQNYTVKDYFTQLDQNAFYIKSLAEKYSTHSFYASVFKELYDKFLQAIEQAKNYFTRSSADRSMILAVLDSFDDYLEPSKFLQKYEEFNNTLLMSLDYLYFDICCLDKVLSLCPQTSNKLVVMAGIAHAAALCNQLKKVGYKSILQEVHEAHIEGTAGFFSADLAYLELALMLFFSQGHIPNTILPKLEESTRFAAEAFKERVTRGIEKYAQLGLLQKPVKQATSETLPSDFKALKVEEQPSVSVPDSRCHNNGCQKKATSTCTRCKKARYCSKECQLTDWSKQHKLVCKPT